MFSRKSALPLYRALSQFQPVLLTTAIFSFFINILLFIGPVYMLQVYDRVLSSRNIGTLIVLSAIAAFLLLMMSVLDLVRSRILVRAGVRFDESLRDPLFATVLRSTLASPGNSSSQFLRDMDIIREFLTGSAFLMLCDAPFVPIFVAVCFVFHFWLGGVAGAGAALLFGLALINEGSTKAPLGAAAKASRSAGSLAISSSRNIEVIEALGMHSVIAGKWAAHHCEQLGWQARASDRAAVVLTSTKFVRQAIQIAILGVGAWLAVDREISPGMMIAASIMMGRALAPVEQAVGQWKQFLAARASWDRLKTLFDAFPEPAGRTALPPPRGDISVENIFVRSPDAKTNILKGVSFRLAPGRLLLVVGPSGSGKSTLARALVNVWKPTFGTVRLDGADLRHWDPERLGRHVGYLPQDVELFGGTIAENIARLQTSDIAEKAIAAAELAGVHNFILGLPEGYDMQIGEGGNVLSGGQRQRIGLARAVYDRPAYIVLDEPNAHLDATGEQELLSALQRIKASGISAIVISHKANLLSIADSVMVLADGTVAAFGAPSEMGAPRIVAAQPAAQAGALAASSS